MESAPLKMQVLRHGFDPFITEALMAEMSTHGPEMHARCSLAGVSRAANGTITVEVHCGQETKSLTVRMMPQSQDFPAEPILNTQSSLSSTTTTSTKT